MLKLLRIAGYCAAAILIIVSILGIYILVQPTPHYADDLTEERYWTFSYDGEFYTLTYNVPNDLLQEYADMHVPRMIESLDFRFVTPDDPVVVSVAEQLLTFSQNMTAADRANLILAFVQALPYESDLALHGHSEYWAFPAETLYLQAGDCDDMAALYMSLMKYAGYDVMFIYEPDHVAVGVHLEGLKGNYIEHNDKRYYIADPTASVKIGAESAAEFHAGYTLPVVLICSVIITTCVMSLIVFLWRDKNLVNGVKV